MRILHPQRIEIRRCARERAGQSEIRVLWIRQQHLLSLQTGWGVDRRGARTSAQHRTRKFWKLRYRAGERVRYGVKESVSQADVLVGELVGIESRVSKQELACPIAGIPHLEHASGARFILEVKAEVLL